MAIYGVTDRCTGGTASAQSEYAGYLAAQAFDNNNGTMWLANAYVSQWVKYDFGAGVLWRIAKTILRQSGDAKDFNLDCSLNNTDWVNIGTAQLPNDYGVDHTFEFTNNIAYRYARINVTTEYLHAYIGFQEIQMFEDLTPLPSGGFSGGQPWMFMKDMWERHNKLWKPKGLILPGNLGFQI